eukprot:SAG31_NODE_3137_length_4632_cov_3.575871_3_plen_310_part_00
MVWSSSARFWFHHISFCSTGVCQTISQGYLARHGLNNPTSGLLLLPTYLGMAMAFPVLFRAEHQTSRPRFDPKFVIITLMDLLGQLFITLSVIWAGGQIFMLAYSSITVLVALLKLWILDKNQTSQQWLGLGIITGGIMVNMAEAGGETTDSVGIGVLAAVVAAACYAVVYVVSEKTLVPGHDTAPSPASLCAFDGVVNSYIIGFFIIVHTGPQWELLISANVVAKGGQYGSIASVVVLLMIAAGVHNWSLFELQEVSGAVAAGVNKAVQTVSVFVAADICFCSVCKKYVHQHRGHELTLTIVGARSAG